MGSAVAEPSYPELREGVRSLCAQFDSAYWQKVDEARAYPEAFVDALTQAGWMSALIPEQYGGSGLSLTEATVIMEEVSRSGGNAGCCHGQMYNMNTLLRNGSDAQKKKYLPKIASGELRMQAMGVTEPTAGTDTTKIKTVAVRKGDRYVVNGQKVWTSRLQHSDLMILLARTTPLAEVKKKSDGMSVFLVEKKAALGKGLTMRPIRNMVNHETNEVFLDNLEIPAENLIGEEGQGFHQAVGGLELGRINVASRGVGIAQAALSEAVKYSQQRHTFGKPICEHQAIQLKIGEMATRVEAARLLVKNAAQIYDRGERCDLEAGMAKYFATEAAFENAHEAMRIHGGYGYSKEFPVERLYRDAPLLCIGEGTNEMQRMIIAKQVIARNKI